MSKWEKRQFLLEACVEAVETKQALLESSLNDILTMADGLGRILRKGGTIYLAGNGGSADCDHFATELVRLRLTIGCPLAVL
jgi:phosphoheptose isomerase